MKKTLLPLAALALTLLATTASMAQTSTSDGGDKVKTTTDGMTIKTKVADDGKMKMKGKDDAGNRMKSTTKPRKGDMKMSDDGMEMHHKGMHRKGMRKDSAAMRPSSSM